jgi:hypothetical protein
MKQSLSSQSSARSLRCLLAAVLFLPLAALPAAAASQLHIAIPDNAWQIENANKSGWTCEAQPQTVRTCHKGDSATLVPDHEWWLGNMKSAGWTCNGAPDIVRFCSKPASVAITWDGTCTPSQVGARGSVTITKTPNGNSYDVTLEGKLSINSPTYGYVRHGVPPGFLPVSTDPLAYTCSVQQSATKGDTSGVSNYGGKGVGIRNDNYQGYQGRATIWFPEKFYNGEFTLRCTWQTNEATDPSAWQSCPGIKVIQ